MLRELSEETFFGGIVLTAGTRSLGSEVWYGERTNHNLPYNFENIKTNGLIFFPDLDSTCNSLEQLKKVRRNFGFNYIGLTKVGLTIYPDKALMLARERGEIILIGETEGSLTFLGQPMMDIDGVPYVQGSDLFHNGFEPYIHFEQALYAMSEFRRQAAVPVRMASFEYERVSGLAALPDFH